MKQMNINFKDVQTPLMGRIVYTDTYWICLHGNATSALFCGDNPQCNRNKAICEHFLNKGLYGEQKNLEIVFLPVAYVPNRN